MSEQFHPTMTEACADPTIGYCPTCGEITNAHETAYAYHVAGRCLEIPFLPPARQKRMRAAIQGCCPACTDENADGMERLRQYHTCGRAAHPGERIPREERCPACTGSGGFERYDEGKVTCPECHGTGRVPLTWRPDTDEEGNDNAAMQYVLRPDGRVYAEVWNRGAGAYPITVFYVTAQSFLGEETFKTETDARQEITRLYAKEI